MSAAHRQAALLILFASVACGREEVKRSASPAPVAATGSGDATKAAPPAANVREGTGTGSGSAGAEGTGSGSEASSGSDQSDQAAPPDTTTPPPIKQITGKEYYTTVVYKIFDAACTKCHADPRQKPDIAAPLTIFSYGAMKKMLDGGSAADSALMKKVRDLVPHSGGDRCANGPTSTPCQEITEWWRLENGADSGLVGALNAVSTAGVVTGYAVNANDSAAVLSIELIVDGEAVMALSADQSGYDGGYDGTHAFKGELPPQLRDGKEHDLSVVAALAGKQLPLGKTQHFAAYTPKDAGRAFFDKTVAPAMGACTGCHAVTYEAMYASLINKPPFQGGAAADNELVNRASGTVTHPGGNLCGSKTGSPCNLFQQWWAVEFK